MERRYRVRLDELLLGEVAELRTANDRHHLGVEPLDKVVRGRRRHHQSPEDRTARKAREPGLGKRRNVRQPRIATQAAQGQDLEFFFVELSGHIADADLGDVDRPRQERALKVRVPKISIRGVRADQVRAAERYTAEISPPDESPMNIERPLLGPGRPFGGVHTGGLNVLFADGSVQFVLDAIKPELFEMQVTIARE